MVRKWGPAVVAAAMLASTTAYAGDTQSQGALAPGGAAGVHQAEIMGIPWGTALLFTAAVIAIVAVTVSDTGNGSASKTTSGEP